ncbi:MAG: pilus assembly protein [Chloroflexota bacterium]|nr:pilus assembly protein [Chloroflexota bacterium]
MRKQTTIRSRGRGRGRGKAKGQALVEFALMGLFLGMLLAAAVDFGRAYYTSIIVTNMAGEGAAYASIYPDRDKDPYNPSNEQCILGKAVQTHQSIQERARRVAVEHGLVVEEQDQDNARIEVFTEGYDGTCALRCPGRTITVRITYTLDDLFLPNMLGIRQIPITKSASQVITGKPFYGSCPTS